MQEYTSISEITYILQCFVDLLVVCTWRVRVRRQGRSDMSWIMIVISVTLATGLCVCPEETMLAEYTTNSWTKYAVL